MTQTEVRNTIVSQLYKYLGGPKVVLSNQLMPEDEYPYLYYQAIQPHIPGPYNIGYTKNADQSVTKYRAEQAEATYSFTACSANREDSAGNKILGDDEAIALADKAQGFFLLGGLEELAAAGIAILKITNTQPRTAYGIDETDRRYGFDVLLRSERMDTKVIGAVSPNIELKEES